MQKKSFKDSQTCSCHLFTTNCSQNMWWKCLRVYWKSYPNCSLWFFLLNYFLIYKLLFDIERSQVIIYICVIKSIRTKISILLGVLILINNRVPKWSWSRKYESNLLFKTWSWLLETYLLYYTTGHYPNPARGIALYEGHQ